MNDLTWTPCESLEYVTWESAEDEDKYNTDALVLLVETDDGVSYYVHRSGQYALRATPIGGGWAWSMARLDRRDDDDRRAKPHGRGYWYRDDYDDTKDLPRRWGGDRRDPDADWTRFIRLHGNGEADR